MRTPLCRHVYACHVRTVKLQPFTRRDTPTTWTGASTTIDSAPRWGGLYWQDCGCPASVHQGRQHGRRHKVQTAGILRDRSEEHTSELQSLMRHSYAVF